MDMKRRAPPGLLAWHFLAEAREKQNTDLTAALMALAPSGL